MAKTSSLLDGRPLLDIASYARRGPGARDHLTPAEIEQIRRTVRRAPEVMVKVLARNSSNLTSVRKHVDYIGRYGDLELEGNDGEHWQGRIGQELLENWDLDLDELRPQSRVTGGDKDRAPKLVHKLMFSMPPGTAPDKVLGAVRNFAREEFGLKHRYAFVLHTDEPHPHVHMVLKAVSEKGARLNIRKATLRHWRFEFARHLRLLGVEANATERAVRGQSVSAKKDGIYRAGRRGESTFLRSAAESVASDLFKGAVLQRGRAQLIETRKSVIQGWSRVASMLEQNGQRAISDEVQRFATGLPAPRTDRESMAAAIIEKAKSRSRDLTVPR